MFDDVQDDAVEEALVETPAPSKRNVVPGCARPAWDAGNAK